MIDVKVLATGSKGNCYRIYDGSTYLLLDAGIPIKQIRQGCNFKLHEVAGALITHSHKDHCYAVKDLVRAGTRVYMTQGEIQAMEYRGVHPLTAMDGKFEYNTVIIGTFTVKPFHIEHDTPEPVGFFIQSNLTGERLVYFTDTYYIHERFGCFQYLIGEVNYDNDTLWEKVEKHNTPLVQVKRVFRSHMSLDNFLEFLRANDCWHLKKIWICHMSDGHANEERIKEAVQKETGVEVEVC